MATASITIPEWLVPHRDALSKPMSDQEKFNIVSELFKIISFDAFPSPGTAKPWGPKEWREWAKTNDFQERPAESNHSHGFFYRQIPEITFGIPKTTSDWRSSMNNATDLRFQARSHFNMMAVMVGWILQPNQISTLGILPTPDNFASMLRLAYNDRTKRDSFLVKATSAAPDRLMAESGQMKGLLKRFMDEFDMTPKKVFMKLGTSEQEAEIIADTYRLSNGASPLPLSTIGNARDLFENMREQVDEEREQKRRERDAAASARLTAQQVKELPSTKFKERVEITKRALIGNHANAMKSAQDAMVRLTHLGDILNRLEIPVPEDLDQFYALKVKMDEMQTQIDLFDQERAAKDQRIAQLEADARENVEMIKMADVTNPFRDRLEGLAKLVTAKLASGDMFVLIPNIAELRKKAEDELATMAKPSTTG